MRALIISVDLGNPDFLPHAEEFAMLAKGAGAEIVGTLTARRDRPDAKFFIGSGKADEGVGMAQALLADIVLFDQTDGTAAMRAQFETAYRKRYSFLMQGPVDEYYRKNGIEHVGWKGDLTSFCQALAKAPLVFSPGERWNLCRAA